MTTRFAPLALAAAIAMLLGAATTAPAQETDEHHAEEPALSQAAQVPEPGQGMAMMGGMMTPETMQMMQQMMPLMMHHMMLHAMPGGMGGQMPMSGAGMPMGQGMPQSGMMPGQMPPMGSAMPMRQGTAMCPMMGGSMPMMPGQMGMMGMMGPQGIGPGMIYGMPGMAGPGVSLDEARATVERLLAWHGNPRLKLGDVRPTEAGEYLAEIVTQDGSLVQRLAVDRGTGSVRRVSE